MKLRNALFGAIASLALLACSAGPPEGITEAERSAIISAVEERVDGYVDAARRKDLEWFLDFWADVDDFVIAGDGDLLDRATWVEGLSQAVGNTRAILDFEFFDQHTVVLAADAAAHTAKFRWAYETMSGDTLRSHGSWTYVFKDFDGVWRVVHSGGTHVPD